MGDGKFEKYEQLVHINTRLTVQTFHLSLISEGGEGWVGEGWVVMGCWQGNQGENSPKF